MGRTYPLAISAELLMKLSHVSPDEVQRDIDDTRREIEKLTKVQEAESIIAEHHLVESERTLHHYKSIARSEQIRERQDFIDYLTRVQAARAAMTEAANGAA